MLLHYSGWIIDPKLCAVIFLVVGIALLLWGLVVLAIELYYAFSRREIIKGKIVA